MRDFRKIEAWVLADDLVVAVYRQTRGFPREETYGLTSQLRRAACSVPANIAEGAARDTKRDYLHFLHIARGSLAEAQYFLHLSGRLGYLEETVLAELNAQARSSFACLLGLIKAVERELPSGGPSSLVPGPSSLVPGPLSLVPGPSSLHA